MEISSKLNLTLLHLTHFNVLSVHYCALSLPNKRLNKKASFKVAQIHVLCLFFYSQTNKASFTHKQRLTYAEWIFS